MNRLRSRFGNSVTMPLAITLVPLDDGHMNTSTPRKPVAVGDCYTDKHGTWVVTWVSRDGSGFAARRISYLGRVAS